MSEERMRSGRSRWPRLGAAIGLCVVGAVLSGCSSQPSAPASDSAQRIEERVQARLGDVELTLEVADEQDEQAVGLMHRDAVPAGTGMVFRFREPVSAQFYMYNVSIPLRAVFIREGRVISSVVMEPCLAREASACPTYGAPEAFDTVVEVAPDTLPAVAAGARYVETR